MAEYYEVHIIQADGTPWAGHTAPTKEQAIKDAEAAIAMRNLDYPQDDQRMEVFECTLVDTIELNP